MRDVFVLEPTTKILSDDPYITSYPHLLDYFSVKDSIEPGDVVCGAHMAYGWMPTILELYPEPGAIDLHAAAALLTKAKRTGVLAEEEIKALSGLVNNSLVGASKLLHFVAPATFAISDSNVYSFVYEKRPHNYRVNDVSTYVAYLTTLNQLTLKQEFAAFYNSVQKKLGYQVSPLRALELIMFLNAPVYGG